MNRRQFIQNAMAATALQALPFNALASLNPLEQVKKTKPWLLGWQSVEQDAFAPLDMQVAGTVPGELQGQFFRNGPAKHERGGVRYNHWFDGDGMIQKFTLSDKSIRHQGQFVHTEKYLAEQKAGKFLYNGAGTHVKNAFPARNNDSSNTANTALLHWDNELLALWEGGSAFRIDPDNLQAKGLKTWRDDMKSMPFSAHPLTDSDGTLWNFGLATYAGPTGMMFIYKISPKTGLQKVQPVNLPIAGFMHDFAITKKHLIFYVPPYHYVRDDGKTYVERFKWSPQQGSKLLVVDKDDLTKQRWFDAPPGFIFHFGNAYEHQDELFINASLYDDPGIMQHGMTDMLSLDKQPNFSECVSTLLRLDLSTGKVTVEKSDCLLEFPGFDLRYQHQSTAIYGVGNSGLSAGKNSDRITRFEPKTGNTDHFDFTDGIIVEEPLFVPRKHKPQQGAGWLINTFLDYNKKQSGITIFDAQSIASGPVTVATMNRHLPLGFHGCFV